MFSMNGTRMWKPADSVRLYLPSSSTMNALCCGTTIAVRRKTKTTRTTAATAMINKPWFMDAPLLLVRSNVQREPVDRFDPDLLAGRDRVLADVHRSPRRSSILHAHRLPGRELLGNSHELMNVAVDLAERLPPELRVNLLAYREHRDDGEHCEQQPLEPWRQIDTEHPDEPDDDRGRAEEDQEELRVDREPLDAEQQRADHEPLPRDHVCHLSRERPGVRAGAIIAGAAGRSQDVPARRSAESTGGCAWLACGASVGATSAIRENGGHLEVTGRTSKGQLRARARHG